MKRIAIIGSGISGLTAAHYLSKTHTVTVFEKNPTAGGHTATKQVELNGKPWDIDTGFIVFNNKTYPRFLRLLSELEVPYQCTEMSFSVTNPHNGLVYNGNSLASLFADKRNFFKPRFLKMLLEIVRFNKQCKALYKSGVFSEGATLSRFINDEGYSDYFAQNYILPMCAAIWSSTLKEVEDFPLEFFCQFFENHGLLNVTDRPQWYTIEGGSHQYLKKLIAQERFTLKLDTPIAQVTRTPQGASVTTKAGETLYVDEVIFACHSDEAQALLADATPQEQQILGALPYRQNHVVLHSDTRFLPPIRSAIASWNYRITGESERPASVTYSMNILQRLPKDAPTFCVSLNEEGIDPLQIHGEYHYAHPVFGVKMVKAQQRRSEISGHNHTHFCGAYWYNGFHEDGVRSALDVCEALGVSA